MTLQRCGIAALLFMMACGAAQAGASVVCELKSLSGKAWIPSRLAVHFSEDFTSALVTDTVFSLSVPARVVRHSEDSFVLTWVLPGLPVVPDGGQQAPRYRAVLNTANQKMSIQTSAGEDSLKPLRGAGRCQREGNLSMMEDELPG